jgi:RsiW-degrading membrane proteinase PrsW (M82 family)
MNSFPTDIYNFLIFIIPGFVVVWTFRYFTDSNKKGDFEFLGLSFVWGLILLLLYEFIAKFTFGQSYDKKIQELTGNLYAAAAVLSTLSVMMGFVGAFLSRKGLFTWIKKILTK